MKRHKLTTYFGVGVLFATTYVDKVKLSAAVCKMLCKCIHVIVASNNLGKAQGVSEALDIRKDTGHDGYVFCVKRGALEVIPDLLLDGLGGLYSARNGIPKKAIAKFSSVAVDEYCNVGVSILQRYQIV